MRDLFLRIARHWGRQWRKQAPRPCSSCARHSDRCGTLWSKGTPGGPKPGRVRVRVGPARPQRHLHAAAWYSAGNSRREFALTFKGSRVPVKGPSDATSHPETMLVHLAPFALLKGGCVPAVTRRRAQHRRTVPVCKGGRAASRSAVVVGGRRLAAGNGGDLPLPGGSAEAPCAVWLQCAPHGAFASALGKLPFSHSAPAAWSRCSPPACFASAAAAPSPAVALCSTSATRRPASVPWALRTTGMTVATTTHAVRLMVACASALLALWSDACQPGVFAGWWENEATGCTRRAVRSAHKAVVPGRHRALWGRQQGLWRTCPLLL